MLGKEMASLFIMDFIIIVLLLLLLFYLLKQYRAIKYEKRFNDFALTSAKVEEVSFLDTISIYIKRFIKTLSKIIDKSIVLKKYSKKYEKYMTCEEKIKKEPTEYIAIKFLTACSLLFFYLLSTLLQVAKINGMNFLLLFLLGFFLPDIYWKYEFKRKREQIERDLLKAILLMNNSFKSGKNITQAIEIVKNELTGPIADEFQKMYLDINYGLSLDVVFDRFYNRVSLEDAKYITSSLTLLNKTGGNIVHVFDSIEKSLQSKRRLREELKSLTASSIFVYRVLILLPFIFIIVIYVLNPTYFTPLFTTALGRFILLFILALYILYILTIKRILKVEM